MLFGVAALGAHSGFSFCANAEADTPNYDTDTGRGAFLNNPASFRRRFLNNVVVGKARRDHQSCQSGTAQNCSHENLPHPVRALSDRGRPPEHTSVTIERRNFENGTAFSAMAPLGRPGRLRLSIKGAKDPVDRVSARDRQRDVLAHRDIETPDLNRRQTSRFIKGQACGKKKRIVSA